MVRGRHLAAVAARNRRGEGARAGAAHVRAVLQPLVGEAPGRLVEKRSDEAGALRALAAREWLADVAAARHTGHRGSVRREQQRKVVGTRGLSAEESRRVCVSTGSSGPTRILSVPLLAQ